MGLPSIKSRLRMLAVVAAAAPLAAASVVAQPITAGAAGGQTREVSRVGTTTFQPTQEGSGALSAPEIAGTGGDAASPSPNVKIVDRHQSAGERQGQDDGGQNQDRPAVLVKSFDGLRHRDQRLANGGNQFSVEPPDQGLCVGNGFVMETVNDVMAVYDPNGNRLKGVTDLNSFYHYPPAVLRTVPRVYGPFVTDPSCQFDPDTQRWIHVVLTLETFPANGAFTGVNHLDIAVSDTSSPLGNWTIYRIDTTDDGTSGTPNRHCSPGPPVPPLKPTHPSACIGDYPHMGADRYGVFFTTNEYSLFGPEFKSANIYAVSKRALTSGAATIAATQFETVGAVRLSQGRSESGFTVWPATSPDHQYAGAANGTEFFMSSDAAAEVNSAGTSNRLIVWSLTNTRSLDATPDLRLNNTVLRVRPYALPPLSDQKPGNVPLAECVNDTKLPAPGGLGCWRFLLTQEPPHNMVETRLDSNDTRMQQVTYANGLLWGALDTALTVSGVNKAGVEWFIVKPAASAGELEAELDRQGYLGVPGNNVIYPAIGVTSRGRGVMGLTLVGKDHYPSAAYAAIDTEGVGRVQVAAEGLGPEDGFTAYAPLVAPNPVRPRWGDYGAAVPVGNDVWIANEYVGQTCDLATYYAGGNPAQFGSCGGTRTALANWYTRISRVRI